jgi:hypothetical protein
MKAEADSNLSSLTDALKRSSEVLKFGASSQILDYEQHFSSLKNLYDDWLASFIRMDFDRKEAARTAKEFFNADCVRFAGIDGTMYSRQLFDLVIFFGGAYASTGSIAFSDDGNCKVKYDEKTLRQSAGISSVVPVYVNDIPEIDQTFSESVQPGDIDPNKPLTDESIVNNSTIANWIMTFAEFYLAYKLAVDENQNTRIILLDRSLSIERASLIYDTAKRDVWKAKSSLIGYKVNGEPIDVNDLTTARQCVCNEELGLPPPRADYLRYAVIELVKRKGPLKDEQILAELEISDENRARRVKRYIAKSVKEDIICESGGSYSLNPRYLTSSERIKELVTTIGDRFFFTKTADVRNSSVMKIVKNGKEHWLTTVDIAFLTLFALHMLMEECWKKHILLVGVTKDTAARDFKRQLVPIMYSEGMLNKAFSPMEFDKLPNTDRMILQSASILNVSQIHPPWSLIEYDSAFRTMIPDRQNRRGYVSGAIKNRMSLEKTFLKTYVQLSEAKSDPMLRSNVLLIDRLVYPAYDCTAENVTKFLNEFGGAEEPVEVVLFRNKDQMNKLQDLVMNILVAMAPSSIPEAFGHNKPLFIADKVAKWNYSQFKCMVDTTAGWIVNNHKLRRFVFYMSTFRERRATFEAARREQV